MSIRLNSSRATVNPKRSCSHPSLSRSGLYALLNFGRAALANHHARLEGFFYRQQTVDNEQALAVKEEVIALTGRGCVDFVERRRRG